MPHFTLAAAHAEKASLRHQALNYKARCLLLTDQTLTATNVLRQLVNDPDEPNKFRNSASLALAHISATSGKVAEAYELYKKLIAIESLDPEFLPIKGQAIVHGGMAAIRLGKSEEGLTLLNTALKTPGVPDDSKAEAQLTLIQFEFNKDNFEQVMNLFRIGPFQAARAETTAGILMYAGRSAAKLGQHNAAVEMFIGVDRSLPNTQLAFEASFRKLLSFYALRGTNLPDLADSFVEIYRRKHPKNPWIQQARMMKAETYFAFSDYKNATRAWEQVNFSRLPEELRGNAYFKSGWSLVENENYNSAIGQLSEFLSRYPDSPDYYAALAKRAQSYLAVGDRISALADCERILENKPKTPLAAFALQLSGRLYRIERKHDKMLECYRTLLTDYSNLSQDTVARAHYKMGIGLFEEGDFEEALNQLHKARQLVPEYYEESAGTYSALCYYRLKRPEDLRRTVARLLSINPKKQLPRRLLIWLGLQMYEQSDFVSADHYLSLAATPSNPKKTELGIWKALAKSRIEIPGQEFRALPAINIVLENESDPFWRADALLDKANAHLGTQQWNDAEIAAHRGLDLDPQGTIRAGLNLALGDVSLARADYREAVSCYVRAAELFLNDATIQPEALHKAALCYQELGEHDSAKAFRERLRLNHPDWSPGRPRIIPGSANIQPKRLPAPTNPQPKSPTPLQPLKPLPEGVTPVTSD
ncbi:MAG: tetratricopeptide repeat protein [Verrucomicrobiota bacterium]